MMIIEVPLMELGPGYFEHIFDANAGIYIWDVLRFKFHN